MRKTLLLALSLVATAVAAIASESDDLSIPVPVNNKEEYNFQLLSDSGYTDENGRRVIDVIEGYQVNLALSVDTKDGQPVMGLQPEFSLEGSSILIPPGESTALTSTDESGILEFSVTAGQKGMDRLNVSFGKNEATVYLNVISLAIFDSPQAPTLEDGLNWNELMQAELNYNDGKLDIVFPEMVKQQDGETVKVSGFMMPLDPGLEQKHFLLTSSPPHCFFHIPGGPAGVIEAFSEEGVEASWEPVTLEGRLKLVENSATGVIYQLEEVQVVD